MNNQALEKLIKEKNKEFVNSLAGRYNKHVSDEFLNAYLSSNLEADCRKCRTEGRNKELLINIALRTARPLFEIYLEFGCKAGGHGHHVAQRYSLLFEGVDISAYLNASAVSI